MKLRLLIPVFAIVFQSISLNANKIIDHNYYLEYGDTITKAPDNWFNLDDKTDKVRGVSTEKAYAELLKDKKSTTIIVAILDSGIDTDHEDLKNKIWTNTKEIAGNGIDDDNNGYIDDINGWNFIGGKDGSHVDMDTWELTRLYKIYTKKFENRDIKTLSKKEKTEYNEFTKIKTHYEKEFQEASRTYQMIEGIQKKYSESKSIIEKFLKSKDWTTQQLKEIDTEEKEVNDAKSFMLRMADAKYTEVQIEEGLEYFNKLIKYKLNPDHDPRHIVGDNYSDKSEKYYGNNSTIGPDAFHGTHVAGIIGAERNNNIGIDGIADNVKFMVLRTVPSGDERDKDVANSIYYAVDNGAKIINMSFGKSYSPDKKFVDKAFKYADKHGVLIVHAAGNDATDNDAVKNFPHREYLNSKKECGTWIEVGASSWERNKNFVGGFSNYGKINVDMFAPGVDIYSTAPGQKYESASGTSMSAPVVSGVAALVWSYFPELTAKQLKTILIESAENYGNESVLLPGERNRSVKFSKLSKSGGIINAYNAIVKAEKLKQ